MMKKLEERFESERTSTSEKFDSIYQLLEVPDKFSDDDISLWNENATKTKELDRLM
jgi:hypothetical protein